MNKPLLAAMVAAGLPWAASAQASDEPTLEQRQQALEQRVRVQDARIEELERLLRETLAAKSGSGTAAAVPVASLPAAAAPPPAPAATTAATPAAAPQAGSASEPVPVTRPPADEPGPEYIGNLGVKLYESDKAQIYMRLFSYARYLNQKGLDSSYTDSFGNVKTIDLREDVQLNKFFLPFSGWFLDPKFRYYLYVWSANTAQGDPAQVVGAGNLSWVFNEHATLGMGITSLPGVRSTEGQFPFWLGVDDRMTADEFFRPSYTSGLWIKGSVVPGVNYMAMLGNNLSTLGVSSAQLDDTIDTYSLMLNWLPTTKEFGPIGAFGDFEGHQELATRIGLHYTHSTEDRQTQPGTDTIENTQIRLTDGNTIFTPDLFAPGTTVESVRYQMVSLDAGFKYRGYAVEAEYYWRKLSDYVGPGTDLIPDIDDHGYQLQASAMVMPRTLQLYAGLSGILGDFGDAMEIRGGLNYFPNQTRGIRVNAEWINLDDNPVGYQAVPYPVGGNGNLYHVNFELNF